MPAIQAFAEVETRISAIRSRIAVLTPSGTGTDSPRSVAFDPFGAAYQRALDELGPAGRVNGASETPPGGFEASSGERTESWPVRVPGRTSQLPPASPPLAGMPRPPAAGALVGEQVARYAYNAGFRGDDLVKVVAIAKRESNWKPGAFNGNTATKDQSYGLMQINMLGDLGGARLQQFGIASNEQLLDPQTNMDAAFTLYTRAGNTLHAWGGYRGQSDTFGTNLDPARQAVIDAGLDPGPATF